MCPDVSPGSHPAFPPENKAEGHISQYPVDLATSVFIALLYLTVPIVITPVLVISATAGFLAVEVAYTVYLSPLENTLIRVKESFSFPFLKRSDQSALLILHIAS